MNNTEELLEKWQEMSEKLYDTIDLIPYEDWDKRHGGEEEEIWSAAQIAQHLMKTERLSIRVLKGPSRDRESGNPWEKVDQIEETWLNPDKKYESGGPTQPTKRPPGKDTLLAQLQGAREQLVVILKSSGAEEEASGFEHGLFGYLTRGEWMYYHIYHGERHRLQMLKRAEVEE